MGEYTFKTIKESILMWSQNNMLKYMTQHDMYELSKNDEDILLYDLTFNHCLAQLTVSIPFFGPYQFVSFEAMTFDSEKAQDSNEPELVYFFYDTNDMTEAAVIKELEKGVKYCSCYEPDHLKSTYLYKRGMLVIGHEDLKQAIHPSDMEKVDLQNIGGKFVCKDTEAQYLVVKNEVLLVRVLPEYFITM